MAIISKLKPLEILEPIQLEKIKDASANILEKVGVKINHPGILETLQLHGFEVDFDQKKAKFSQSKLYHYISLAASSQGYCLYGRDLCKKAAFGSQKTHAMSSSGQYMVYDWQLDQRRNPQLGDLIEAAKIAEHLPYIDIVGAFAVPSDTRLQTRELEQTIGLLNHTSKPISIWFSEGKKAEYCLEIMDIVRDGQGRLKDYPFCECFIEAISPLQFTKQSMEILIAFAQRGLPIGFGPMAMQGATAPATIAGTLAQENAEVLAGIVISQVLNPGNPVTYWGIPHCMDLKTGNMSFGSPEQSLMAVAITQLARSYGFSAVGVNEGLSDSNLADDAQNGFERGISLINGIHARADILAHQGICGQDMCASLLQLIIDDELLSFLDRYFRSFTVNPDTLAEEVIARVGIGGNFLTEAHTLAHFRREIYTPRILNRDNWDSWQAKGKKSTKDLAIERYGRLKELEGTPPLAQDKAKEIRNIVKAAGRGK